MLSRISVPVVVILVLSLAMISAATGPRVAAQPGAAPTATPAGATAQPEGSGVQPSILLPPIDIFPVPVALRRRAAQFLEEMRDSPLAQDWEEARLSFIVRPIYRPDLAEIAYYEFQVLLPAVQAPDGAAALSAAGFIIVAAGEHDYPIPHWSDTGPSPTEQLIAQAKAAGAQPTTFFKLDTLAYAAEDAEGRRVAKLGTDPMQIVEVDPAAAAALPAVIETHWQPGEEGAAAPAAAPDNMLRVDGQLLKPPFKLIPWTSWGDLKLKFGPTYAKLLDAIRVRATREWEFERLSAERGEILVPGESYVLALLNSAGATAPQITLSGPGAAMVQTELIQAEGRPPALRLSATSAQAGQTLPFEVQIAYADGQQEAIKFVVASGEERLFLPMVITSGETAALAAAPEPQGAELQAGGWSNWVVYSAGSPPDDQRLYRQIYSGEAPNNDTCLSGCGATAWAMLFGWADYQAAQNRAPWTAHRLLYRQNGGRGPVDAVAPKYLDAGVKNMIWEIRNHIGTFCGFGSEAATAPWNMEDASAYIAGRDTLGLSTLYNAAGYPEGRIAQAAINSIVQRKTPVVIGTGTLGHYPLAYAYAWRSRRVWTCDSSCAYKTEYQQLFYVNQGWEGAGNSWVPIDTWFAGQIWP